ncbi:hypothetical protein F1880_002857 [Penicillium rolfsii]|nr:hypothetical protein F1880_002857 [Penicillium rolfsii]
MALPERPPASLPPQQPQNPTLPQPVATESSQYPKNQVESGISSLPQNSPTWTDLTSPGQTGSGQTKQDFLRQQQSGQTNRAQQAIPGQRISQQLPTPPEAQQQPMQQARSQNGLPPAVLAEAVLVPHTIGQMGSHVFPIASGQYQVRVISYMEVLLPIVPCPAQPPPQ